MNIDSLSPRPSRIRSMSLKAESRSFNTSDELNSCSCLKTYFFVRKLCRSYICFSHHFFVMNSVHSDSITVWSYASLSFRNYIPVFLCLFISPTFGTLYTFVVLLLSILKKTFSLKRLSMYYRPQGERIYSKL